MNTRKTHAAATPQRQPRQQLRRPLARALAALRRLAPRSLATPPDIDLAQRVRDVGEW